MGNNNTEECICHHCNLKDNCKFTKYNIIKRFVYNGDKKLTANEYKILEYLIINKGLIMTYNKIIEYVWNDPESITNSNLHTIIWRLRKKIPDIIYGIHGLGYYIEKVLPDIFKEIEEKTLVTTNDSFHKGGVI